MAVRGLVMTGGGGLIVIVNAAVAVLVPPALEALTVILLKVPVVVIIPEISPLVVFTESPVGNPVALKLVGLLFAVIW